ncbi:MAG: hypothetical protein RML40_01350 [Bacteroidota bacterium]|nr:hypothetical protein [Candidatus Kapabacteria bacterium]MDW8219154.1 hypothetical protein [Bacteroidota bacterium]
MYTIEPRSYGLQITIDAALEPHELEKLATELKQHMRRSRDVFAPLGILVRPSQHAQSHIQPRMYLIE